MLPSMRTCVILDLVLIHKLISRSPQFALFFPGEKACKTNPKESIWALHSRAAILWNCCQQLRSRPEWDCRRDELAGKAWVEISAIEEALEQHQCPEGHGIPYTGREYVLQYVTYLAK